MVKIVGSQEYEPMPSANAENNSIFVDISDKFFKFVDNNGIVEEMSNAGSQIEILNMAGCNAIRQLQDRTVPFSVGGLDAWSDAYIDTTGRLNTVNTSSTTAFFNTNRYGPGLQDGGAYTTGDSTTGWTANLIGSATFTSNAGILKMYSPAGDADLNSGYATCDNDLFEVSDYVEFYTSTQNASSVGICDSEIVLTDGTNRATIQQTRNVGATLSYTWRLHRDGNALHRWRNGTPQGDIDITTWGSEMYLELRAWNDANGSTTNYAWCDYITNTDSLWATLYDKQAVIEHIIPSGTFSSTISELSPVTKLYSYESGSVVDCKLLNYVYNDNTEIETDLGLAVQGAGSSTNGSIRITVTRPVKLVSWTLPPSSVATSIVLDGNTGVIATGEVTFTPPVEMFPGINYDAIITTTNPIYNCYPTTGAGVSTSNGLLTIRELNTYNYIAEILDPVIYDSTGDDDSGWLTVNTSNTFTTFTSEPTKFILRITPATTPTNGVPAISGMYTKEVN